MNSFTFPPFVRRLALLASLTLVVTAARADIDEESGTTARAKFSDASKPGTLKVVLPWAEARISAIDGNEVIVTSSLDQKGKREVDHEGFRRLDEDVTFDLVEKDNVISVSIAGDNAWASHGAEFEIKVPRKTNLILRTEVGGDIEVNGVEGDLDINSVNSEIRLIDVASSAVVNTMNGEIKASFKTAPTKPVALSSMNGEIDLRLPSDTKANLRMRTHNGSIRTNFPAGALETKTEKVTGGRFVGSDSDQLREFAKERARIDRDAARAARDAARATADAARATADAARVTAEVNAKVDVEVDASPSAKSLTATRPAPMPHPDIASIVIPPIPPLPPSFGGKSIVGSLNGGGVDIKLTSMNGTITLRENK